MAGLRFTDLQSRPTEFLDLTSVTRDEFQLLVPPFEAAFQAHMRAWRLDGKPRTARRFPVDENCPLPPTPRGPAAVYSGLPEDLCAPGGAGTPVRDGPEQSQSVDSCPLACVASRAPHPWRYPGPFPHSSRATAGCCGGRGGDGGRAAGGGMPTRGPHTFCPSRRASLPPWAHDGTERRIVCPQDAAAQTRCYSGKKKDHTVKNVLLVDALLTILFLSETYGGRVHDKRIAEATPYPLPVGSRLLQDLAFPAFTLPKGEILMPVKKPCGQELTREQQRTNQLLHQRRLRIEHVHSSVKRCRIVKDRLRLWKAGVRDLLMELCCALHNFRVRLTPWQPMI
jgi:DDE superfamily endonuclease